MSDERSPSGVSPDGYLSHELLDVQAMISKLREDVRAARQAIGAGNPAAQTLCARLDTRLDALQERIRPLELEYYTRAGSTRRRRKQGE